MIFTPQPGYCCVCGQRDLFEPTRHGFIHRECIPEFEWRRTLYIMGKDYYPASTTGTTTTTQETP